LQKEQAEKFAKEAVRLCTWGMYKEAHDMRLRMEDVLRAGSGINLMDVRLFSGYQFMDVRLAQYMNKQDTRERLNVGNRIWSRDPNVTFELWDDMMRTQADKYPELLRNLRVLLYIGNVCISDTCIHCTRCLR
jgi:hypothetical protein